MCEYCENGKAILKFSQIQKEKNDVVVKITKSTVSDGRTLYFISATLNGDGVSTEIKICPMCGRKLTEEKEPNPKKFTEEELWETLSEPDLKIELQNGYKYGAK